MPQAIDTHRGNRLFGIPSWIVKTVPVVVIVVLAFFSVTVVSTAQADKDNSTDTFNATTYAAKEYDSKIAPAITADAVDLADLLAALKSDPTAAQKKYGHTSGANSPYSYSVKTTAVAGTVANGLLPLKVTGIDPSYTVYIQVGPSINGTALRDATGLISFGQFTNQIDYQNAAIALNEQVKKTVIAKADPASLAGKTVSVTGAYTTGVNPVFIGIVPVSIEVKQ
jgi:predicted lipoprotein